jgi:hypothetical protein
MRHLAHKGLLASMNVDAPGSPRRTSIAQATAAVAHARTLNLAVSFDRAIAAVDAAREALAAELPTELAISAAAAEIYPIGQRTGDPAAEQRIVATVAGLLAAAAQADPGDIEIAALNPRRGRRRRRSWADRPSASRPDAP